MSKQFNHKKHAFQFFVSDCVQDKEIISQICWSEKTGEMWPVLGGKEFYISPDDVEGLAIATRTCCRSRTRKIMSEPQIQCCTQMNAPETRAVSERSKRWITGQTITVTTMGVVDPYVVGMVRMAADRLLKDARINLKFSWSGDPNSDIRISFTPGGSWSYVGTDCKLISSGQPTMNYGWFNSGTAQAEVDRTVGHEFLHALGGLHEMVSSIEGIDWNRPVVYDWYKVNQGWDSSLVDSNVFATVDAATVDQTSFDSTSLLCYPIPVEHVKNPAHAAGWNQWLSEQDIALWASVYPY